METLEQILKMWESDAVIDQTEPSRELLKIPVYHSNVSVIESIMAELKQRTWQLRDFISWEKFVGGQ